MKIMREKWGRIAGESEPGSGEDYKGRSEGKHEEDEYWKDGRHTSGGVAMSRRECIVLPDELDIRF